MKRAAILLVLAVCAGGLGTAATGASRSATVASIQDGDTLTLADGRRIRLVQIDTPELGTGECYSRAARKALVSLAPVGSRVELQGDPALDSVDRYGRLLRYVWRNGRDLNVQLVRVGAAAPYFYRGDRGRYADLLLRLARAAKAAKRGLWGACPRTVLDPNRQVDTGTSGPPSGSRQGAPVAAGTGCAASYPTVCIPPPPPDLDCKDIPYRRFTVRWDVPDPDPHHFDGNHDGVGCEL